MSGYEVEHGIKEEDRPARPHHLPDMSTFFSNLEQIDTSGERTPLHNIHSLPTPENVTAAFRLLANAYQMAQETGGHTTTADWMIQFLMQNADDPPTEVKGVPESFLADLERVDKKKLKKDDTCPICNNPFLEGYSSDQYPLVVVLPCHKDHMFDYECIQPWLKLNPTCPLDRKVLVEKKKPPPPPQEDDEEDYDDMYA